MTEIVSSTKFEDLIRDTKTPLLVDVYADWCPPCRAIAPSVKALGEDLEGQALIVKINRDEASQNGGDKNAVIKFMADNGIRGIPALLLFDQGEFKGVLMGGPRSKENIQEWMEETLGRSFNPAPDSKPAPRAPQPPHPKH
jgi:thiol-disulfide isomerase/thioredoxin